MAASRAIELDSLLCTVWIAVFSVLVTSSTFVKHRKMKDSGGLGRRRRGGVADGRIAARDGQAVDDARLACAARGARSDA